MLSYEFKTEMKEGIIKVPDDYMGSRTGKFRVVIIAEEDKQHKLRKTLLNAPVWDDKDVENFQNTIRKGYENWMPEEF